MTEPDYNLTLKGQLYSMTVVPKTNDATKSPDAKPAVQNAGDITEKPEPKTYILTTVPKKNFTS